MKRRQPARPRSSAPSGWRWPKAAAVSARQPAATVIGSDQVAVCKGEVLGEARRHRALPRATAAAVGRGRHLLYRRGRAADARTGASLQFVDTTTVYFRALQRCGDRALHRRRAAVRLRRRLPAEGLGITLFARIVSEDPTALIGLPLIALAARCASWATRCRERGTSATRAALAHRSRSSTARSSGGSGALKLCLAARRATRTTAVRVQEHALEAELRASSALNAAIAVLLVARDRVAAVAACTRIWCVRPVCSVASSSDAVRAEVLDQPELGQRVLAAARPP